MAGAPACAALAAPAPVQMRFACAKQETGQLRYVAGVGECRRRSERVVRFRDDRPVIACARRGEFVHLAGERSDCRRKRLRPSLVLKLPGATQRSFCAHKRTGALRSTEHVPYHSPRPRRFLRACHRDERRVFVPVADRRPRAADDAATVDEDHLAAIAVLANDRDPEGKELVVASLDAGGTTGAVAATANGQSVSYDPSGRFEALAAGAHATETFGYRASDGVRTSRRAGVTVTVAGVNDAPGVTATGGRAPHTEGDAATVVDAGVAVADVDSSILTSARVELKAGFEAGVDVLAFSALPGISGSYDGGTGVLRLGGSASVAAYETVLRSVTFASSSDAPAASRTIQLTVDDGAPANHESAPASREVEITHVNDKPVVDATGSALSYTESPDPTFTSVAVDPGVSVSDADSATIKGATVAIGAGYVDGEDELTFSDTLRITGSFSSATGTLTLTGNASVADYQTALRSVRYRNTSQSPSTAARTVTFKVIDLEDARSVPATRDIAVTPGSDAPVADDESFGDGARAVGNTSLVVDDPGDAAPNPAGPRKTVSGDVLDGDVDPDSGALTVTPATTSTNDGGGVTIEADGDFTFQPAPGTSCTDHSDFFDYTVSDGESTPQTDTGRVTIEIQDCVWYVDGSAPGGGDGRSHAPFASLADVNGPGDPDAAGQKIFLYDGAYSGGLALEDTQILHGRRHGLSVADGGGGSVVLEPAGGGSAAITGGVTLARDNTIQGIDLGNAAGPALSGTSVGNAVIGTVTAGVIDNQSGQAVSISGGALNMVFSGVSSNGATASAVALTSVSGTFDAAGGTLTDAASADVALNGGSVDFTYGGTITDDLGQLVSVSGATGGTKDFNGAISDLGDGDGSGIALSSNGGATIRFDGGLTLGTGANPALAATGGGTLAVTDPPGAASNTIATTTGTALTVANTTIGVSDLTFERISSNGAASAIVLAATGSGGGLAVTGNGAASSGGTIQGSTGPGISLTSVGGGAQLTRMLVTGGGDDGIRGTTVDGFAFSDGSVTDNGNAVGENGMDFTDLTGTVALTGATVTGSAVNNVSIVNDGGALDATVTGGSYGSSSTTIGGDGILLRGTGTGTMTASIENATFMNNRRAHVHLATDASTTVTQNLTVDGATMTSTIGSVLGGEIWINPGGDATADATLTDNNIQGAVATAIIVEGAGTAAAPQPVTIRATISGNTIGTAGTTDSGSKMDGIRVSSKGGATVRALVNDNTIRQYANLRGINLIMNNGNGTLDATVRGNSIANPGTFADNGILVRSGTAGGTENTTNCFDIGGSTTALKNALTGSGAAPAVDMIVRQLANTTVRLPGYGGGPLNLAAVTAYLQGRNNPVSTPTVTASRTGTGGGFVTAGSCALP